MMQASVAINASPLLSVRDVSVVFGGIVALNGVSFDMLKGQILGLIGPNGAGKTTLFNLISGRFPITSGEISLNGTRIDQMPPHNTTASHPMRPAGVTTVLAGNISAGQSNNRACT